MPGKVRRIVTGHNAEGKAIFLSDRELPAGELGPNERVRALMWLTDSMPVSNDGDNDPCPEGKSGVIHPPTNGTIFRVVDIPPDSQVASNPQEMAARGAQVDPARSAKHPGFHRTDTLDYAICLEGEIWAVVDEGETLMKAGDILIQRGTYHAWSNRSDKPCRMAFVLIDAYPVRP
ncbi:MAG TPA: cupin domain-containing protein [Chloroflexota bacterium]|nr:cupin domain-containing protein [Chloroflexota bacterium]